MPLANSIWHSQPWQQGGYSTPMPNISDQRNQVCGCGVFPQPSSSLTMFHSYGVLFIQQWEPKLSSTPTYAYPIRERWCAVVLFWGGPLLLLWHPAYLATEATVLQPCCLDLLVALDFLGRRSRSSGDWLTLGCLIVCLLQCFSASIRVWLCCLYPSTAFDICCCSSI